MPREAERREEPRLPSVVGVRAVKEIVDDLAAVDDSEVGVAKLHVPAFCHAESLARVDRSTKRTIEHRPGDGQPLNDWKVGGAREGSRSLGGAGNLSIAFSAPPQWLQELGRFRGTRGDSRGLGDGVENSSYQQFAPETRVSRTFPKLPLQGCNSRRLHHLMPTDSISWRAVPCASHTPGLFLQREASHESAALPGSPTFLQ